jgi:hypothetical protein
MKTTSTTTIGVLGLLCSTVYAGSAVDIPTSVSPSVSESGFDRAIRPMTNPTLFDLALPTSNIHPIFLHHALPDQIGLAGGGTAPLGGDAQLYALQFEYALSERLSIVATKDGYADMNFDNTLTDSSGFANLGGGVKYAFHLDPVAQTALSGSLTFEFPTGNSEIFQGEGKGLANMILSGVKLVDDWQFAGGTGLQVPFSNEQATMGWLSTHVSYEVSPWFIPLVELNWFTVLDEGNGTGNFGSQLGGGVPGAVSFEGGDLFNLGATNASDNANFVSAAIGFRSRLSESVTSGIAYEIPLTDDENSLMDSRLTLDLIWRF